MVSDIYYWLLGDAFVVEGTACLIYRGSLINLGPWELCNSDSCVEKDWKVV